MAVCVCSTGMMQLLPKAPAVTSSLSAQLRPGKGVQGQCGVTSLSSDCAYSLGYSSNKGTLIHSSSVDNSQKWSTFRHDWSKNGRNSKEGGGLRRGCKVCGRLEQRQIIHVQVRLPDTVGYETYDGNELGGNYRTRDRSRRQNNDERRKRVQVIANNGVADLEEQLGVTQGMKKGKLRLRLSSQQNRSRVQRDEQGRLCFEYDFNETDVDDVPGIDSSSFYSVEDIQTRQGGDAPSLAQAATPLEIGTFLASERDTGRSSGVELGAEERWSSEQEVEIESMSFKFLLDTPGGQRVADLVGAWDGLAGRLPRSLLQKVALHLCLLL